MSNAAQVSKLYRTVVDDVINNVKEAFLDEGVDEQVLQELKQLWENKLAASKAMEPPPSEDQIALAPNPMMLLPQSVQGASAHPGQQAQPQPTQMQTNQQYQPSAAAATATLALPQGLFQQQIAAIGAGGQIQNITVQQTGTGQFITLAGLTPQQLPQFQQQQQQRHQQPQQQQTPLAPQQITPQMLQQQQQPQHIHITQQQQQAKLIQGAQILQTTPQVRPGQQVRQAQGLQNIVQLDGLGDTSSSDDDDDDLDDDKDDDEEDEKVEDEENQGEEEEPLNSADDVSEEDPMELFDTENVVVCQYDKINRNKNKWKFYLKDGIMSLNGRDFVFQKANGDAEW